MLIRRNVSARLEGVQALRSWLTKLEGKLKYTVIAATWVCELAMSRSRVMNRLFEMRALRPRAHICHLRRKHGLMRGEGGGHASVPDWEWNQNPVPPLLALVRTSSTGSRHPFRNKTRKVHTQHEIKVSSVYFDMTLLSWLITPMLSSVALSFLGQFSFEGRGMLTLR